MNKRQIPVIIVFFALTVAGCGSDSQTKEEFLAEWHAASEETHGIVTSALSDFYLDILSGQDQTDEEVEAFENRLEADFKGYVKDLRAAKARFAELRPSKNDQQLVRLKELSVEMLEVLTDWARVLAGENADDVFVGEMYEDHEDDDSVIPLEEMKAILDDLGEESKIVDTYALLAQITGFNDMPEGYDNAMPIPGDIDRFWDFSDPEATEKKFREALDSAPEDAEEFRAELMTQIARTLGLRGMFDEAHAVLDEVAELLPRISERVETRYLLERGRAFNSNGDKEKAKQLFLQAVETGKLSQDDYLTIDAMHMMGIVEEPEAAIEWQKLGLQMVDESSDKKAKQWTGALTNNLGWTFHDKGDFETALAYFEKGRDYRAIEAKEPGYRIAKWTVARCKRSLGRIEEALAEQIAILKEYFPEFDPEVGDVNTLDGGGYVAEEIAECYLALGKDSESKPFFSIAFKILSQDNWLVENEPDRINRLEEMGN